MRHQKIIALDDNRALIVRELQVRQVRQLIGVTDTLDGADIVELLLARYAEIEPLLGDCVQLPPGESLDDLAISEIDTAVAAFLEVNASFLALMQGLGLVATERPAETETTESSTAPASA